MTANAKTKSDMDVLKEARMEVSQAMSQTMDLYGYTPSTGMLYSLLYFSEDPLSLDDLARALEVSKTTVCTGARSMEERGLLAKSWKKGSRRDHYRAETDFFNNFLHYFSSMWQREIDVNLKAIAKAEPVIRNLVNSKDRAVGEMAGTDLDKLQEAKKYYRWLEKLVDSIDSKEIFKLIPVPDETK